MARRVSADDVKGGYESGSRRKNSFEEGRKGRKKRLLEDESDASAGTDLEEAVRHRRSKISRREILQRPKTERHNRKRMRRFDSSDRDSENDSATETPAESEATDTTCSSRRSPRGKHYAKRRYIDDIGYNSDYAGYAKYNQDTEFRTRDRYVAASEECLLLNSEDERRRRYKRSRQEHMRCCVRPQEARGTTAPCATGVTNTNETRNNGNVASSRQEVEVLKLMGCLFRSLGNANNEAKGASGLSDAACAQTLAQIMHETIRESKAPKQAPEPAAEPTVSPQTQLQHTQLDRSFPSQLEYEAHVTTVPRLRAQYPTANAGTVPKQHSTPDAMKVGGYAQMGYTPQTQMMPVPHPQAGMHSAPQECAQHEASLNIAQPAQFAPDFGRRLQPQQYPFPHYVPALTQPKFETTSSVREYIQRPTLTQPYAAHSSAHEPVAAYTRSAVQSGLQAASLPTYKPPTLQSFASPGNLHLLPSTDMPVNKPGTYSMNPILPPIQSIDFSDPHGVQEFVLSRAARDPQDISLSEENHLGVTYIEPQPKQLNEAANAGETQRQPSLLAAVSEVRVDRTPNANLLSESNPRPVVGAQPDNQLVGADAAAQRVEETIAEPKDLNKINYIVNNGVVKEGKANRNDDINNATKANENGHWATEPNNVSRHRESKGNEEHKASVHEKDNAKSLRRSSASNGKSGAAVGKNDHYHGRPNKSQSEGEAGSSSSCSSDYIRKCLRRKRQKKKDDYVEKYRSRNNKRYKRKRTISDSGSEQLSNDYSERSRYSVRGKARRRRSEPYTPTGSESDDEMDYSLSRTSSKAIKKCCSRIVAICRMARDTAGTQTDECCCIRGVEKQKVAEAGASKSKDDIRRKIIDYLRNADQKAVCEIMELSREKKMPGAKNDIIVKFEPDDTTTKAPTEETDNCCKCDCSCSPRESSSELIRALITKKRLHEKTRRSLAKSSNSFCACLSNCTCVDEQEAEREFVDDLLRKQRSEKKAQNNYEECVCDCESRAKELAAQIMKEMINGHIRAMCAERLAETLKNKRETEAARRERSFTESEGGCTCGPQRVREETQMKIQPERIESNTSKRSSTRLGNCTCDLDRNENAPRKSAKTTERRRVSPNVNVSALRRSETNASLAGETRDVGTCTCGPKEEVDKQERGRRERKRVINKETSISSVDGCTCKPKEVKPEAHRTKAVQSKSLKDREVGINSLESIESNAREERNKLRASRASRPDDTVKSRVRESQIPERAGRADTKQEKGGVKSKSERDRETKTNSDRRVSNSTRDDTMHERLGKRKKDELEAQKIQPAKYRNEHERQFRGKLEDNVLSRGRNENTRAPAENKSKGEFEARRSAKYKEDANSDSDYKPHRCRSDCACGGPSESTLGISRESVVEKVSDNRAKVFSAPQTSNNARDATKHCRSDCGCKQAGKSYENHSQENVHKSNSDVGSSGEDEWTRDSTGGARKSVQKFIIDFKASKKARASCTLVTYPKSIKNIERNTQPELPKAELSSNSSMEQNQQRAALCAELAMNDLLPENSLRTLLTKLSSPNGKLFYADDTTAENARIFNLDQSKLLNLKRATHGKVNPTLFMAQSMGMTGRKEVDAMPRVTFQPLLVSKKRQLKISNSAPSQATSLELAAASSSGRSPPPQCGEESLENRTAITAKQQAMTETAFEPTPGTSHSSGYSNQSETMSKSESAETRANARPVINQTSDSNHQITRLWPDQQAAAHDVETQKLAKHRPNSTRPKQKVKPVRPPVVMDQGRKSLSNIELIKTQTDRFACSAERSQSRLVSGTHIEQQNNLSIRPFNLIPQAEIAQKKEKRSSSPAQNLPLNILDASKRRPNLCADTSTSNESTALQQQQRSQKYSSGKVKRRKASIEQNLKSIDEGSAHSFIYVARAHSPTAIFASNFNKPKPRQRAQRFSISDDEQTESDVEYISMIYESSDSDRQYQFDLERKKELWRNGTVREALEVEEESARAKHHNHTTLTGECLERAIHYPTRVWNEERRQLNLKRNGGVGLYAPF